MMAKTGVPNGIHTANSTHNERHRRLRERGVLGLFILCGLLPIPATAQTLDLSTIAFASGATADWVTTYQNVQVFDEANPLLHWLDDRPKTMIAAGVAMDVGVYYGWRKVTKNHTKLRAIGLYSLAAVRAYVAYRNVQLMRRYRADPTQFRHKR